MKRSGVTTGDEHIDRHFEVYEEHHAFTILEHAIPEAWADIQGVLQDVRIDKKEHIEESGGGKSKITQSLERAFRERETPWQQRTFKVSVKVGDEVTVSTTHEVDCYKSGVAIEVEWNTKATFFDRDLSVFRHLYEARKIDVGVIITRSDDLDYLFLLSKRHTAAGTTTTRMKNLLRRLDNGHHGGCPILAFGIKDSLYSDQEGLRGFKTEVQALTEEVDVWETFFNDCVAIEGGKVATSRIAEMVTSGDPEVEDTVQLPETLRPIRGQGRQAVHRFLKGKCGKQPFKSRSTRVERAERPVDYVVSMRDEGDDSIDTFLRRGALDVIRRLDPQRLDLVD